MKVIIPDDVEFGTWNHRVIKHVDERGEVWYGIHEAHYNAKGEIEAWTDEPTRVMGDNVSELRETLERMLRALDTPIIDERGEIH